MVGQWHKCRLLMVGAALWTRYAGLFQSPEICRVPIILSQHVIIHGQLPPTPGIKLTFPKALLVLGIEAVLRESHVETVTWSPSRTWQSQGRVESPSSVRSCFPALAMDRPMEKDSFWDLHRRLAECYMSDVAMSPMILGRARTWWYLGGVPFTGKNSWKPMIAIETADIVYGIVNVKHLVSFESDLATN